MSQTCQKALLDVRPASDTGDRTFFESSALKHCLLARQTVVKRAFLTTLAVLCCSSVQAASHVEVWELPTNPQSDFKDRSGWSVPISGTPIKSGAVLENQSLLVVARPGSVGVGLYVKDQSNGMRTELAFLAPGTNQGATLSKVEVSKAEASAATLRVTAGAAEVEITLGVGAHFVTVKPVKNAANLEIRSVARYAVLPDFFADDTIYDPTKFTVPKLSIPAENFLLQFADGGNTIVMCVWPGNLQLPNARNVAPASSADPATPPAPAPKAERDGLDPQVDLFFTGEGTARRITATRIEFQNKPVYVGILEQKGLWQDQEVSALEGYKSTPIAWKRPIEARWRGDFILADGKNMNDWPTRHQSFEFKSTADPKKDKWWERGDESAPQIWQESLADFFVYPSVFKGDEVRLCLYADKAERRKADNATVEARKTNKDAPAIPYPNLYERVIIYPLDRVAATPISAYTPVDLMRETLGAGPCEYVLDISGVKPRPVGGDRPILSYATCGLWMDHIFPITREFKKKPDGTYEPLNEKTKAHLIQALEDMWYFVHAIHDRLREYKKWGADNAEFCTQQATASPKLKPLADRLMVYINKLNSDIKEHRFEGPGTEAYWKDRIQELIKQAKEDKYAEIGTVGQIRNLGNTQDERVSRCRQYVKVMRQQIALENVEDPEVRNFATAVRDRCQKILRNAHQKEGF